MRQVYSPSRSIVAPHRQQNCFFFLAGWITLCRHSSPGHTHCTRVMESVPPALRTAGIHARRVRSPGHSWKAKPRGAPPVGLQQRHLKIQTLLRKHFHDVPGACPIPGHRIWQPKDTLPGAGTTPTEPGTSPVAGSELGKSQAGSIPASSLLCSTSKPLASRRSQTQEVVLMHAASQLNLGNQNRAIIHARVFGNFVSN